jgi:phospholipid/cholesterol/gamma-HCH transport system substrate-binding protein
VAAFSGTARTFLQDNGDNMIRLGKVSAPQLRVLSRYSTEFPCLTTGIVNAGKLQAEAFRGFTLHIILELLPNQPRGYGPQDVPHLGEDRGPNCLHLPNPPWSQSNPVRHQPNFDDGVDEPTGKGTSRTAPGYYYRTGDNAVGSPEESALLKALLGPGLGLPADDVPDLGVLLLGPMARGGTVSMR